MKKTLLLIGTLLLTAGSAFSYSMPRWGMTAIDVYLPENENSHIVRSAFEEWSNASGGRIRFRYQSTRFASNNAQIKVEFSDANAPYFLAASKRSETTGYFTTMDDGFINRATLTVYPKTRDGEKASYNELKGNILFEVGYILGLDKRFGRCSEDEASAMCLDPTSKNYSGITKIDIKNITKKYDRSSDDIKERKNK